MRSVLKKTAIGLGVIIAIAHIGALGHLIEKDRREQDFVTIPLPPVNEFSSYRITATRDGYTIDYIGNDPRVLTDEAKDSRRGGFLGFGGNRETSRTTEYTQDGSRNQGGEDSEGKLGAQDIACIEAAGGGRSSGAIVGGSLAAAVAPTLISIPYVGWLAAGWATLFAVNKGGDIGASAQQMISGC